MQKTITPRDINTDRHFWNAFDNSEMETAARVLVKFSKEKGDWVDFTKEDIDAFHGQEFFFHGLIHAGKNSPIRKNKDGTYSFTHIFVANCYNSSPVTETKT